MNQQKIETFAIQAGRFKVLSILNKNLVTVTMTIDIFGNILFHAYVVLCKGNMAEVLWYPLTSVPLSLCHPDGTMQNTPKSSKLWEFEKRISS